MGRTQRTDPRALLRRFACLLSSRRAVGRGIHASIYHARSDPNDTAPDSSAARSTGADYCASSGRTNFFNRGPSRGAQPLTIAFTIFALHARERCSSS